MITLSKIAKLAHVSVSTASKAFSMSNEVNAETREMIFEIAKKYGCFKKFYNAKYPKLVFAVICPEFASRFYADALSAIQEYLKVYNCEICVATTDFSVETEKTLLEYYTKYTNVDAIFNIAGQLSEFDGVEEIPVVNIFPLNNSRSEITVKFDLNNALQQFLQYCKEKGIEDIGFIGEKKTDMKLNCFQQKMEEVFGSFRKEYISTVEQRFEYGGFEAMRRLFATKSVPRVIVCAYDCMAMGAMRCICEHGLKVPEDIAVLGIDDTRESAFLPIPISSINLNLDEACKQSIDALMNKLYDRPFSSEITISAELKLRESSKIFKES